MTEDLFLLPLAEADQIIKDKIEHHRDQMQHWSKVRGTRIAAERAAGKSVYEIASELGVRTQMIYKLLKDAGQTDPVPTSEGLRHYVYAPDGTIMTIIDATYNADGELVESSTVSPTSDHAS